MSSPCFNNGTCVDLLNNFQCNCQLGFTGTHCETDIDECVDQPCQNNGTCHDLVNKYFCYCAAGNVFGLTDRNSTDTFLV